jgi:ribosomal protein S18 acetylase RimI-like enzyme
LHKVTTYYLETHSLSDLNAKEDENGLIVRECVPKQFSINQFLYLAVGDDWQWTDKSSWRDNDWRSFAEAENMRTWVAWLAGTPAGYYELQVQEGSEVEVVHLGLLPHCIGKEIGCYLLTHALRSAWELGASRVWLHTCSLDHPSALGNYQARGMKLYRTESKS